MKKLSDNKIIKTTFVFSLLFHFLLLGFPSRKFFIHKQPCQKKRDIWLKIEMEKPTFIPRIDKMGKQKKLKQRKKLIRTTKPKPVPKPKAKPQPQPIEVVEHQNPVIKKEVKEVKLEEKIVKLTQEKIEVANPYDEIMLRYQDIVKQRIESCRTYPRWAKRQGYQGTVFLEFTILPNGLAKGVVINHSSQFKILDDEAVSTVKRANPFPPLPEDISSSSVQMQVAVVFKLNN